MRYVVQKPIWEKDGVINIAIREKTLINAIKKRESVEVIWNDMVAFINPKEWIKHGTLIKKVFKFPDNPMRMIQGTIKLEPPKTEEDKLKEFSSQCL